MRLNSDDRRVYSRFDERHRVLASGGREMRQRTPGSSTRALPRYGLAPTGLTGRFRPPRSRRLFRASYFRRRQFGLARRKLFFHYHQISIVNLSIPLLAKFLF